MSYDNLVGVSLVIAKEGDVNVRDDVSEFSLCNELVNPYIGILYEFHNMPDYPIYFYVSMRTIESANKFTKTFFIVALLTFQSDCILKQR